MLGTGRKESRKKGKVTTGELFFTLSFMWYLPWGPQKFFHDIIQGRASGMDWTLNLIFGKSETSRDIKK